MLKPSVEVQVIDGVMVAEFWDCLRLDPNAVQDLRTQYESLIKTCQKTDVIVDLLGVAFAGSAALGHFVALHRIVRAKGGRIIFCNVDPTVLEVFRATKLVPLFSFVADRSAAFAEVQKPAASVNPGEPASDGIPPSRPPGDPTPPATPKSGGAGLLRSSRRRKLS